MMKLGLETESLHLWFQNLKMDIFQYIDLAHEIGFDGVEINVIQDFNLTEWGTLETNEKAHLDRIKQKLKDYGMYLELDMRNLDYSRLVEVLEVAHYMEVDLVRTYIPIAVNRKNLSHTAAEGAYDIVKVKQDFEPKCLTEGIENIRAILPLLERYEIKLCLENHEYETSQELLYVIEQVNSPWVGLLFDFGNSMMAWEDPLQAARNMAPYTFMTHCKDHIVIADEESDFGYVVCGVPLGEGNLPLGELFEIIRRHAPVKRLNLEMCYPYCAEFKRSVGTGGVFSLGRGAFQIEEKLYPELKAKQYYYPQEVSEQWLSRLLEEQMAGVKKSYRYLREMIKSYE